MLKGAGRSIMMLIITKHRQDLMSRALSQGDMRSVMQNMRRELLYISSTSTSREAPDLIVMQQA